MSVRAILNRLKSRRLVRDRDKMIAEKNYEGAWVVSDIVGGYWVTRRYYYYSKREALAMFRAEVLSNA